MLIRCIIVTSMLCSLAATGVAQTQGDAAKIFKANCALCHSADGSGNTGLGKSLKAPDLRSPETQKQSDAALTEVITKGHDKMPAFGAKIKPDDVTKLVAYIRTLAAKK
jgi:mono/diheme cytochrome c family protein